MSRKIEAGDVKGAIQLANTENTLTEFSDNIVSALQPKHPSPHPNSSIPPPPSSLPDDLVIPASLVVKVINPSQMASLEVQTSYISKTCCQKTKLIRTHLSLHYWQANTLFKSEQAIFFNGSPPIIDFQAMAAAQATEEDIIRLQSTPTSSSLKWENKHYVIDINGRQFPGPVKGC